MFPKAEEAGRNEVMKIMYGSQEWKYSVTFDIVKLGLAYDKSYGKKLSKYHSVTALVRP